MDILSQLPLIRRCRRQWLSRTDRPVIAPSLPYYSQTGQDRLLDEEIFQGRRSGFFVDVGAYDGVTGSNTCFFERSLGWSGLCIEPLPHRFESLQMNRRCRSLQACVAPGTSAEFLEIEGIDQLSGLAATYDPIRLWTLSIQLRRHGRRIRRHQVGCVDLNQLLDEEQRTTVDLLSIDTEGSEQAILESLDFSRRDFLVIVVENIQHRPGIPRFLGDRRYSRYARVGMDEIYRLAT